MEVKPSLAPPRRQASTDPAPPQDDTDDTVEPQESVTTDFPPDAKPHLVAAVTHYKFGTMDPFSIGQHAFKIKNVGDGPLRLTDHRSTCKCTASSYPTHPILPGQEAEVTVVWKTQSNDGNFEQSTAVLTNDPAMPELELTIQGDVLVHVGAEPQVFNFADVRPDEAKEVSSLISSQVWEEFTVSDVTPTLEGITWRIEPATAEELKQAKSISGHRLTLVLPKLAPGLVNETVQFRVVPKDGEAEWFELPMKAKILKRVAVYGPGIDATGTVDLGIIDASRGLSRKLFVKVYDRDAKLQTESIETDPSFVDVSLQPHDNVTPGLYRLQLNIPPNSPACRYQGQNPGTLQIRFQHPRISELRLRLRFAVADSLAQSEYFP